MQRGVWLFLWDTHRVVYSWSEVLQVLIQIDISSLFRDKLITANDRECLCLCGSDMQRQWDVILKYFMKNKCTTTAKRNAARPFAFITNLHIFVRKLVTNTMRDMWHNQDMKWSLEWFWYIYLVSTVFRWLHSFLHFRFMMLFNWKYDNFSICYLSSVYQTSSPIERLIDYSYQ